MGNSIASNGKCDSLYVHGWGKAICRTFCRRNKGKSFRIDNGVWSSMKTDTTVLSFAFITYLQNLDLYHSQGCLHSAGEAMIRASTVQLLVIRFRVRAIKFHCVVFKINQFGVQKYSVSYVNFSLCRKFPRFLGSSIHRAARIRSM